MAIQIQLAGATLPSVKRMGVFFLSIYLFIHVFYLGDLQRLRLLKLRDVEGQKNNIN